MLPCADPELVPDPDNASAEEINVERVSVARAYVCEKTKRRSLIDYVRGL